jgi:hypothetical protein
MGGTACLRSLMSTLEDDYGIEVLYVWPSLAEHCRLDRGDALHYRLKVSSLSEEVGFNFTILERCAREEYKDASFA